MFPDQALRRDDLAIDELCPHDAAFAVAHRAVIGAADAEIHCRGNDHRTLRAEPFLHLLRHREAFPQRLARRVEGAGDDELGRLGLREHVSLHWVTRDLRVQLCGTMTIHCTPNLSVSMPKRGEKNVLASGIVTVPPSPRAPNSLSASASLAAETVSAKP